MRKCLTIEEKIIRQEEKERVKKERELARENKRREKEAEKELRRLKREKPPTEEELVRKYAKRIMMNQRYHGRVDDKKFEGMAKTDSVNKNLWLDTDFFFSVVFQSQRQKMEFFEKLGLHDQIYTEDQPKGRQIQIVNGIEFAKKLGITLNVHEKRKEYPTGNVDLMPFVLDCESFLDHN